MGWICTFACMRCFFVLLLLGCGILSAEWTWSVEGQDLCAVSPATQCNWNEVSPTPVEAAAASRVHSELAFSFGRAWMVEDSTRRLQIAPVRPDLSLFFRTQPGMTMGARILGLASASSYTPQNDTRGTELSPYVEQTRFQLYFGGDLLHPLETDSLSNHMLIASVYFPPFQSYGDIEAKLDWVWWSRLRLGLGWNQSKSKQILAMNRSASDEIRFYNTDEKESWILEAGFVLPWSISLSGWGEWSTWSPDDSQSDLSRRGNQISGGARLSFGTENWKWRNWLQRSVTYQELFAKSGAAQWFFVPMESEFLHWKTALSQVVFQGSQLNVEILANSEGRYGEQAYSGSVLVDPPDSLRVWGDFLSPVSANADQFSQRLQVFSLGARLSWQGLYAECSAGRFRQKLAPSWEPWTFLGIESGFSESAEELHYQGWVQTITVGLGGPFSVIEYTGSSHQYDGDFGDAAVLAAVTRHSILIRNNF